MIKNQADNKTETITRWVNQYSDDLINWAYYKTFDSEIAKDLVQDTFLSAFQGFESFENKSNHRTWLFSILNNKIIDFYRKKTIIKIDKDPNFSNLNDENLFEEFFDNNDNWRNNAKPKDWENTENLLDNQEFLEILYLCLSKLPKQWNSAIIFKYIENKDGKNICQELGLSPSNFWQILHRAKLQLRNCLENNWFISEL